MLRVKPKLSLVVTVVALLRVSDVWPQKFALVEILNIESLASAFARSSYGSHFWTNFAVM